MLHYAHAINNSYSAHLPCSFLLTVILLVSICQRDTTGLTTENSELKVRLQTMEQQVHLQDGKIHPTLMIDGFYLVQHFSY
jgi:hypothetical protein